MKFYMLVLALDTTTRRGSAALARDGAVLDCEIGDPGTTHGQRLPGDLVRLLDRHHLVVGDIDLFAVAAGPGSFTGLRVGIATMQGLAMANGRPLVGLSALDALNAAIQKGDGGPVPFLTGVWMDAQRGEVFSALYRGGDLLDGPSVEKPADTLARWMAIQPLEPVVFVGEGALAHAELIVRVLPSAIVLPEVPPLAPAIARLAAHVEPTEAIRPIYVRRPDAELARDRRRQS
jgi:tRNA threonylcarbamoyladenosine biosynthesis protein TsaB